MEIGRKSLKNICMPNMNVNLFLQCKNMNFTVGDSEVLNYK